MPSMSYRTVPTVHPKITYHVRWYQRAAVWLGIGINPAAITLGGGLAAAVSIGWLLVLIPIGAFCLAALSAAAGIAARRQRSALAALSTVVFGVGIGSLVLNLLMGLGMIGWGGFQLGLTGGGLNNLLGIPLWASVLIVGIAYFTLANLELNRWNGLAWVTTTASMALAITALFVAESGTESFAPTGPNSINLAFWVISSCIAYGGLFALRCTDFTWDLQSDREVLIDAAIFFLTVVTSLFIGVILFRRTGSWDLVVVFGNTRLAVLGHLFIIVALTSPALSGLHSGSLALSHVFPISKRIGMVVISTSAMLLGITRFDQSLLPFLGWIGALLPPALIVILVRSFSPFDKLRAGQKPLSPNVAVYAWLSGAAVAVVLKLLGQETSLLIGGLIAFLATQLANLPEQAS